MLKILSFFIICVVFIYASVLKHLYNGVTRYGFLMKDPTCPSNLKELRMLETICFDIRHLHQP